MREEIMNEGKRQKEKEKGKSGRGTRNRRQKSWFKTINDDYSGRTGRHGKCEGTVKTSLAETDLRANKK